MASSFDSSGCSRSAFELISSYIDGEVTSAERRQVEHWLGTDQRMRGLYHRLLRIRMALRSMPIPVSQASVEQTMHAVQSKAESQTKRILGWVGIVAALLAVSTWLHLSGLSWYHPEYPVIVSPHPASEPPLQDPMEPLDDHPSAPVLPASTTPGITQPAVIQSTTEEPVTVVEESDGMDESSLVLPVDESIVPIPSTLSVSDSED